MAGAGVTDAVVPTQGLLGRGHFRTHAFADHTVSVVVLVHHARGAPGAVHLVTRLCEETEWDDIAINDNRCAFFICHVIR